ncbi:RRXRR domain-containing protein [Bacillus rhizoplanae]
MLVKGTIELRQDVKEDLTLRATLRRDRRQQKTRYRWTLYTKSI